jgi:type I restriction enzyme, S subunit
MAFEQTESTENLDGIVGTFPRGFSRSTSFSYPLVRADRLVTLNYGKGLVEKNRVHGTVPVYGTNGQCGWHNEGLVKGPGVILGRKGMGPLGVEWCESNFWVIDTAYYVTLNTPDLDLKFFYYLTKYIGLNHLKDGTSNPSLSRDTFSAQLLPFPPIAEQKAIAHILGTLDDKIELNQQMNQTLEAIARALFKSWFIDFDPVRAKMDGRQPVDMDAETAALFPDGFEDSTIGQIPKGWKIDQIKNQASTI